MDWLLERQERIEKSLTKIAKQVARRKKKPLKAVEIGLKVGKVLGRYKVGKHFDCRIGEGSFSGAVAKLPSSRKRSWTGFMCCVAVNPLSTSLPKTRCAATRAWRKSSVPFGVRLPVRRPKSPPDLGVWVSLFGDAHGGPFISHR